MKSTGKTLTLRGTTDEFTIGNNQWYSENILDYANVLDINKAWKVRWCEVWFVNSPGLDVSASDQNNTLEAVLATEDIGVNKFQNRADDNRLITWIMQLYSMGRKAVGINSQGLMNEQVVVDPDHIIQKELNIFFRYMGGSAFENQKVRVNYIIYLEEMEISPTESIISTIKQSAQSLNQ